MPENKTQQLMLSLPYEELKNIQGTTFVRDNYSGSSLRAYKIPFKDILIRENYNARKKYEDIPALAESIFVEGQKTAFDLVVTKEGAFLKRGHRRHMAYKLLIEQGRFKLTDEVLFFPANVSETELDMTVDLYTSNNLSEKLDFLEQAEVARRIKFCFGEEKTNEEIGALMKLSRQTVDNLVKIACASDELKNQMFMADMNYTQALTLLKDTTKLKKQSDKAEENSHKNTASPTQLPYDPNAEELAELKLLEEKDNFTVELEDTDVQVDEEGSVRISNHNPDNEKDNGQPLSLVGNTVANGKEEKPENDGNKKYDDGRPEIKQQNNCISLNDRIAVRVEKLEISEGDKKDILAWLGWQMNDLLLNRDWIHSNKKQNKRAI